jgi:hypothetical protein
LRPLRHLLRGWLILSLLVGCARLDKSAGSPLTPLRAATETVGLEIFVVRIPQDSPDLNDAFWNEIDEQQFPAELRRKLAANGFRAGVVGNRLPLKLEQLLKLSEEPAKAELEPNRVVDFENEPPIRRRLLQILSGRRANIICLGEHVREPELVVLMREADGQLAGRTYHKVMGLLAAKAIPQGDGRVQIELVPELEHGEPQRRFEPGDGMLRVEFGPPHERFEMLRLAATLSPGQMLLVTGLSERTGSLGYQFFIERNAKRSQQKLLLVRLAQTQYDDLFTDVPQPNDEGLTTE